MTITRRTVLGSGLGAGALPPPPRTTSEAPR